MTRNTSSPFFVRTLCAGLLALAAANCYSESTPPQANMYDKSELRGRFKAEYVDRNVFEVVDRISDPHLRYMRMAAFAMDLDEMSRSLVPAAGTRYFFIDKGGHMWMSGASVDDIPGDDDKKRFLFEKEQFDLNCACLNAACVIWKKLLDRMGKMADESHEGDARQSYEALYRQIARVRPDAD